MHEKLEKLIEDLPIIKQLFGNDAFIMVVDKKGVVQGYAIPNGATPQFRVGELFHDPSGVLDKVLKTGESQHNSLTREARKEIFEGELVPIKDGNEIVGCIISTFSIDMKKEMTDIALKFRESVDNINTSLHTLVNGIENLLGLLSNMNEMADSVESDVSNATEVVKKINNNASHSNILALNASIEAARSGELGRGFAVVASEMSKLAKDNGSSSKEIQDTLDGILQHLVSITSSIKEVDDFAKEQQSNITSIENVLDEMIVLAGKLEEDIKKR